MILLIAIIAIVLYAVYFTGWIIGQSSADEATKNQLNCTWLSGYGQGVADARDNRREAARPVTAARLREFFEEGGVL